MDTISLAQLRPGVSKQPAAIAGRPKSRRMTRLPTDRVVTPAVGALPSSVERTGIEPVTSGLQSRATLPRRAAWCR